MCVCTGFHVLLSGLILVLTVSTALARASGYMRAHGAKELWPYFQNFCNLSCEYGYQTDVEGNYVCLCHDPCQNVRCFGSTQCKVDLPKACNGFHCRPHATCKDLNQSPSSQHGILQADDATTTSSETSLPARCLLQVTDEAKKCRKMRMRWYFDDVTGSCQQFRGCRTTGNNFRGKRGCEKTCLVKRSRGRIRSRYPLIQSDDASVTSEKTKPPACLLPAIPVTSGCRKTRKRWFFDKKSGTCKRFRSCRTPGNSFSKKKYCRRVCQGKKSVRRKGRRNRSTNQ